MNASPATDEQDFLPPAAWRSEAFAEDLCEEPPQAPPAPLRAALLTVLGPGLALAGALAVLLRHTA
jgi:hypothetical protein